MDKYLQLQLDAEKALATLIGWLDVEIIGDRVSGHPAHFGFSMPREAKCNVEQWTRNWNACGRLMVEHGCYPEEHSIGNAIRVNHTTVPNGNKMGVCVLYKDHPTKDDAVRFAIVYAITRKIEFAKLLVDTKEGE